MLDGKPHLRLQAAGAAIPKQKRAPRQVPKRRRVAPEPAAADAAAVGLAVAKGQLGVVTGCTSDAAAGGDLLVEKQALSERHLVGCWRIGAGARQKAGPAELGLQRAQGIVGGLRPGGGIAALEACAGQRREGDKGAAGEQGPGPAAARKRAREPAHQNLAALSSMSEMSAEISPLASTGCAGGMTSGQAVLRRWKSARTLASPAASMACSSLAIALSICSDCQTKPRLSWYSTGLVNLPSSMASSYSDWAARNTATTVRTVKVRRGGVMKRLAASSAAVSRCCTSLRRCS